MLDPARLPAPVFPTAEPLSTERVLLLRDLARPYEFPPDGAVIDTFLGIDVGSVSTNLVVLDQAGEVVKAIYTKTQARPVEVVDAGLAEIRDEIGDRIRVLGLGTTGSGRELVGELCGADLITDEITAHKTGADFISRSIARQVDTIFEIGGQDSKFISMQDGIVVDFAMNEACAAGTGSFLEEQAEKLGIDIVGEFADLALQSTAPIRLGERCTVFMERDVMSYQSRGASRKDLVAGLAYSIAYNYLNRLVRERKIGDCIFFQGGTAYNDAVAAAFAQILGKEIIVPPHNGVMGAIGMALLARERMGRTGEVTTFRGWDLSAVDYTVKDFVCKHCSNECDIRQFTIEGEKTYWGDKCSDRYRKRAKVDKKPVIADLVALRERLLLAPFEEAAERSSAAAVTRRHPAHHVHLRPPAVLVDLLRPPRRTARPLARHRQGHPRERRRHDRGRALLSDQGGPRPRRGALQAGRRLRLPAQRVERGDRVSRGQLARLSLGPDAALRDSHGAASRALPRPAARRRACGSGSAPTSSSATCGRWPRSLGAGRRGCTTPWRLPTPPSRPSATSSRPPAARRSPTSRRRASSASSSSGAPTTCTTRA